MLCVKVGVNIPEPNYDDPKELYAFFGLAYYNAALLEHDVLNLAVAMLAKQDEQVTVVSKTLIKSQDCGSWQYSDKVIYRPLQMPPLRWAFSLRVQTRILTSLQHLVISAALATHGV